MSSNVFRTLLERKIDTFINTFSTDSNSIFKDINNKLIHPGEYGMYKEEAFKELLRMILNKRQMISDGFIISADGSISTQCDILVYNYDAIPLIDSNIAKFFPIEEVNSIGEIKSGLTKTELRNALRKMAENKRLCDNKKGTYRGDCGHRDVAKIRIYHEDRPFEYDILEKEYMISFLVCQKIKGCVVSEIDWEEIYDGIDRKYWHNAILSIEDGFIGYSVQTSRLSPNLASIGKFENVDNILGWWFPSITYYGEAYNCDITNKSPVDTDEYRYIFEFLSILYNGISEVYKQEMDPVPYLGMDID